MTFPESVAASKPASVILLGITNPDPLELICTLRDTPNWLSMPIAILGAADELPGFSSAGMAECSKLRGRFASLLHISAPAIRSGGDRVAVDLRGRELRSGGLRRSLTPLEIRLLVLLLRHPHVVFSRREFLRRVGSSEYPVNSQIIDVLIARIRKKLALRPGGPEYIRMVRGLGYFFDSCGDSFLDDITGQPFITWPCCS
jgi:hypothetical protein